MVKSITKWLDELRARGLFRSPEEWLDDPERIDVVASMSPRRQAVLFLRYALDLPQDQVSEILGVNQQAISRHERLGLRILQSLSTSPR